MSDYALTFFSKRNDDGSFQYSSGIHSTVSNGSHQRGRIFEDESAFVQAISCFEHSEGGVSNVLSLLQTNSTFDVPQRVPISDEQAVIFGWILPPRSPKI